MNEPQPVAGKPILPRHLCPVAKKQWERVSDLLDQLGLLTPDVGPALEQCACAYADWRAASDTIAREGTTITSGEVRKAHPALNARNQAATLYHKWIVELGLTPSARARVKSVPPADESTPLSRLIAARGNGN